MSDVDYEKLGNAIDRAANTEGLELVGWDLRGDGPKSLLRITIDREQGVTHEDCVAVTNHVGTLVDVEDLIPFAYTLEVSSPGLGKGLADRAAFDRHRGEIARIRANEPVEDRTSFKGRIERVTPTGVTLVDAKGQEFSIEFRQIVAANIVQAPKRPNRRPETGGQL